VAEEGDGREEGERCGDETGEGGECVFEDQGAYLEGRIKIDRLGPLFGVLMYFSWVPADRIYGNCANY